MKQDRKLNKMIMFASVLGVMAGIIVLVAGAGIAVFGFLKPEELLRVEELTFLISEKGIYSLQKELFGKLLKLEYLYLFLGVFVGVVGLLAFIFATLGISYAKKHKVVRRRGAILIFNLIPLAIAGAVATYLVLQFDRLPDMIKYVGYGLGGVFGVIGLFNLFGVICSRSEKFMSNDNNKLAFNNSSLREARAEVNSKVKDAEYQPINQEQNIDTQVYQPMGQPNVQTQPTRAQQPRPMQGPRPTQQARPMPQQRQMQRPQQGQMPMRPQMARPAGARPQMNPVAQPTARPVSSQARPMARPGQMPAQPTGARPQPQGARPQQNAQRKFCLGCGSMLTPGEMVCKICGTKVNK